MNNNEDKKTSNGGLLPFFFMKGSFKFIVWQFLSFFVLLILGKVLFLIYHFNQFSKLIIEDQIGIFIHGLGLDISIVSYLLIVPFFLILFENLTDNYSEMLFRIAKIYHLIFCLLISCIIVVDLELYRTWGIKIDDSPMKYLAHPSEMFASVAASPFYILVPILVLLIIVSLFLNLYIFKIKYENNQKSKILATAVILLLLASLIIPIRGGFQLAPINQSSAYFSTNYFANQAAVNPVFNLFHTLNRKSSGENPFQYLNKNIAEGYLKSYFVENEVIENQIVTGKPNILLITWESLTSKALNQQMEVLPNFKKLINEGIFFDNCYASGDRSDKGLVAILSGYPAQPITSIITLPQKTKKLPVISKDLIKNGYSTAWYYGGEPEFANMKSYILTGQFQKLITKNDFPEQFTEDTKWGANDEVVFSRLFNDLGQMQQPFFVNYFTLSSHEPFEIPNHQVIKGEDETSKFLNAHHFTDEQLGNFIEKAKTQDWYQNTLIIITADHGHRLPITASKKDEFHIPLLFIGGALKAKPMIISQVCSQNDIAKSVLAQLSIQDSSYNWSRNLFAKQKNPSAYFAFNNGFGLVQTDKWFTFDNHTKQVIQKSARVQSSD
ncbi:MAG: sulfatase-like hydrolase/transferase, partial [Bacteroidota bacterium]